MTQTESMPEDMPHPPTSPQRDKIIPIREFKLEWIPPGSNILVCGRRGMGKTHLTCDLLTHRGDCVPVVFASKYVSQRYRRHIPSTNVVDTFDSDKLKTLLDRQLATSGEKEMVLAFDDVSNANECLMNNETVRDLVKYGSSLRVTSVFAVQHAGVYDETFRRNVDYLFIFHDNLLDDQRVLYERYADMFESFAKFQAMYNECTTAPYRCLVIDMRTPWKRQGDGVYWYASASRLPVCIDPAEGVHWGHTSHHHDDTTDASTTSSKKSQKSTGGFLRKRL